MENPMGHTAPVLEGADLELRFIDNDDTAAGTRSLTIRVLYKKEKDKYTCLVLDGNQGRPAYSQKIDTYELTEDTVYQLLQGYLEHDQGFALEQGKHQAVIDAFAESYGLTYAAPNTNETNPNILAVFHYGEPAYLSIVMSKERDQYRFDIDPNSFESLSVDLRSKLTSDYRQFAKVPQDVNPDELRAILEIKNFLPFAMSRAIVKHLSNGLAAKLIGYALDSEAGKKEKVVDYNGENLQFTYDHSRLYNYEIEVKFKSVGYSLAVGDGLASLLTRDGLVIRRFADSDNITPESIGACIVEYNATMEDLHTRLYKQPSINKLLAKSYPNLGQVKLGYNKDNVDYYGAKLMNLDLTGCWVELSLGEGLGQLVWDLRGNYDDPRFALPEPITVQADLSDFEQSINKLFAHLQHIEGILEDDKQRALAFYEKYKSQTGFNGEIEQNDQDRSTVLKLTDPAGLYLEVSFWNDEVRYRVYEYADGGSWPKNLFNSGNVSVSCVEAYGKEVMIAIINHSVEHDSFGNLQVTEQVASSFAGLVKTEVDKYLPTGIESVEVKGSADQLTFVERMDDGSSKDTSLRIMVADLLKPKYIADKWLLEREIEPTVSVFGEYNEELDMLKEMVEVRMANGMTGVIGCCRGGRTGKPNEDRLVFKHETNEVIVIDGMGGMSNGDKAAQIFAAEVAKADAPRTADSWADILNRTERIYYPKFRVGDGGCVFVYNRFDRDQSGNYTQERFHLGDARNMLIFPDGNYAVSHDHTPAQDFINSGHDNYTTISKLKGLAVLNKYVGDDNDDMPDYEATNMPPGTISITSSDWLHDNLTPDEIAKIWSELPEGDKSPKALFVKLSEIVNKRQVEGQVTKVSEFNYSDGYSLEPKADNGTLAIFQVPLVA